MSYDLVADIFRDTIQLIMITTNGVKENEYSGVIQNQVVMDDLFKEWR